jgi:hypothetical protein
MKAATNAASVLQFIDTDLRCHAHRQNYRLGIRPWEHIIRKNWHMRRTYCLQEVPIILQPLLLPNGDEKKDLPPTASII